MAVIEERTNSDGKTKYRVLIRMKGYPVQSATFDRKSDAKNWASQTESAIRDGRHFKTIEAKKHTLGDLVDRYIESVLPTKPKKLRDQQEMQLLWWKKEIGYKILADVSSPLIAECRDKLLRGMTNRGTKRSPATVVRYLSALSHAFTVAVNEWEWLEHSPTTKIKKPTEPRGRVRFLDQSERERLLKACQESDNPLLYPVVVLAITTGMRQGEISNIKWKDVDFEREMITLHETKNGERRVAPLVGLSRDLLHELSKVRRIDNFYVFPSKTSANPANLRKSWMTAIKNAGIEDFHFHDLRHTAASYLAMNGATLAEIAEVLGHKTLAMVKRYAHMSDAHTAGVVKRMSEKIFG